MATPAAVVAAAVDLLNEAAREPGAAGADAIEWSEDA
jgi:hypothetical protein